MNIMTEFRNTHFFVMLKDATAQLRLFNLLIHDSHHFSQSSYYFQRKNPSIKNLRGEITFQSHAIEKGFLHANFRPFFGKKRLERLFQLLELYKKLEFDENDTRFRMGVSVIRKYVMAHQKLNYEINGIKNRLAKFQSVKDTPSGVIVLNRDDITADSTSDFSKLAAARHSVRIFDNSTVDLNRIKKALLISERTPSVCNRQSWHVYIIEDDQIKDKVLRVQGGISDLANNIGAVAIVTTDNSYFGNITERNQGYIDGGLFSMTFLYALTEQGLATCALNTDFNLTTEKKMRRLGGISPSENLILVIAIGNYPKKIKVPVSERDSYTQFTTFK